MRDIAQDLMDRFAGFVRAHTSADRARSFVGVAFIAAALVVLLLGLRWFTDQGDDTSSTTDQSWALDVSSGGPTTTIGASPEAVAVRVGTAVPRGAEEDSTVTIGIPGTSLEVEIPLGPTTTTGPGSAANPSTGGSPGGDGTTPTTRRTTPTTRPTTTPPTNPTTTPTTGPTTTPSTTDTTPTTGPTTTPSTTETTPAALDLSVAGDAAGGLLGELASLLL